MITATIGDVLKKKGGKVVSIESDRPVRHAVELMVRHNVGSVLLMHDEGICGIFTERDVLRKLALGTTAMETPIVEVASCNLVAVEPSCTVAEAMAIMTDQHCRHLPVMAEGRLVGLVSIGDLVRQATVDQKFHISFLTDYIKDTYPG